MNNTDAFLIFKPVHRWQTFLATVFLLLSSVHAAEPSVSKSWPNWLGRNHDGISMETGWSSVWPEGGLSRLWTSEVGIGFSSISIADGRLVTMGHMDGVEVVWCLDANTGKEIWTHRYPCGLNNNLHEGGPAATPTIDGEYVYTLGKEGQLYCLDFQSGVVVWQSMLQKELDVHTPEWGFSSSPIVAGDHLILEAGRVVSFNKKTGFKNWQTSKHEAGYGSAAIFLHRDNSLIATLDNDGLRITKLDSGDEIAFQKWPSPFRTNATTPIIEQNRISISTAYQVGCGLFEFDGLTLKQIYANRQMRNHFNNSILFEGYLYGIDGNSNLGRTVTLTCMNFATGDVAWKQQGMGCGSLMIADGKLLILTENGELVLAKASPQGYEECARSPFLTGRCWTVPVLFDKRIYGRNAAGNLVCVELP